MGGGVTREQDASLWPPTWADTRGPMLSVGRGGQRARDQVEPGPVQHRALAPHAGRVDPDHPIHPDLARSVLLVPVAAAQVQPRLVARGRAGVRREGAVLDRARFDLVTRSLAAASD